MKVKTWDNVFTGLLIISVFYLIMSAIPPTVMFGVYVGGGCAIFCSLLLFYSRRLVKQGHGEERRP